MKARAIVIVAYLAGVVAVCAPIAIALTYTGRQALHEQRALAEQLAQQTLRRSELITTQVLSAIQVMEKAAPAQPCSSATLRLMATATMRFHQIQDLAYVRDGRIICSSLGLSNIDIGPPDYRTPSGNEIRLNRKLIDEERALYRITTSARSGYSAIAHAGLTFDSGQQQDEVSMGQISTVNQQPITLQGTWNPQWAQRLEGAKQVSFFDGDYVVALQKSERYTYFTYAALPADRLKATWQRNALFFTPLGLIAGLVLAFSVYFVAKQRLGLLAHLRQALRKDDELYLHYQPVVDMQTGRWVGAEALIRWHHPNGETISPAVFVPAAERFGLIGRLTRKVITMAAQDASALLKMHPDFKIAINFAATNLYDDALTDHLAKTMKRYSIAPESLTIEATERTFIDADQSLAAIQRLRALGHRVSIDDFGTGYSSLSYLTKLEIDAIKIDRSFIEPIGTEAVTARLVDHIIEMVHTLQLSMIAEGVETEAQADYLRQRGVQLAQGWLYARAMPMNQLARELGRQQAAAT